MTKRQGVTTHLVKLSPLRRSLIDSVRAKEINEQLANPKSHIKEIPISGPKPYRGNGVSQLTDDQILEVRRMHEVHGMKPKAISIATGLKRDTVIRIINYQVRSYLVPPELLHA